MRSILIILFSGASCLALQTKAEGDLPSGFSLFPNCAADTICISEKINYQDDEVVAVIQTAIVGRLIGGGHVYHFSFDPNRERRANVYFEYPGGGSGLAFTLTKSGGTWVIEGESTFYD